MTTLVSSGLNDPTGVAVDGSGNVYIADSGNNAIEEWNASTQQVTTLVSSGLNEPDRRGGGRLRQRLHRGFRATMPSRSGMRRPQQVTTLVSSGLNSPTGVAVDGSGNVYFADQGDNAIKEWSASTQQLTTLVPLGSGQSVRRGGGRLRQRLLRG